MRVIPFQLNAREYNVFVALDDESMERIKAYDPAQLNIGHLGRPWRNLRLNTVLVGYATPADIEHFMRLAEQDDWTEGLKFLSRGFEFKPEAGDYDGPYLSLKKTEGPKQ